MVFRVRWLCPLGGDEALERLSMMAASNTCEQTRVDGVTVDRVAPSCRKLECL